MPRSIYLVKTVLLAAAVILSACGSKSSGEFSASLGEIIRSEKVREIDLATVSSLPWDELFAFGPYSMREDGCRTLKLSWFECRVTLPAAVDEGEYLLVFRLNSKVIKVEHHSRSNGDFYSEDARRPQPILRSAAVFSVLLVSNRAPQGQRRYRLEYQDRH
jgi:hypothetical protein